MSYLGYTEKVSKNWDFDHVFSIVSYMRLLDEHERSLEDLRA